MSADFTFRGWPDVVGPLPFSAVPLGISVATAEAFSTLTDDDELIYLLEAESHATKTVRTVAGVPGPFGSQPFGPLPEWDVLGADVVEYLSDKGFIARAGDSVAPHRHYKKRLAAPFNVRFELQGATAPLGAGSGGGGTINILGWRELTPNLADRTWLNRKVEVKVLKQSATADLGDRATVFAGTVADVIWSPLEYQLEIRDPSERLRTPFAVPKYLGTGNAEGGDDLTGQAKPCVFGKKYNWPLQLIDFAEQIYQGHFRLMQGFDVVRVRGEVIAASGSDYASYALLEAATVPAGQYATCLAEGMLKLGSNADGVPTADIRGDAQGGYIDTVADITKRCVTELCGAPTCLEADELNAEAFSALNGAVPGEAGLGLPVNNTREVFDVVNEFLVSAGCFWGFTRDLRMFATALTLPTGGAEAINHDNIRLDSDGASGARAERRIPAVSEVSVGWRQAVRVQDTGDLATVGVTDADRAFLEKAYRYVTFTSDSLPRAHRGAGRLEFNSPFNESADAQAMADRIGAFVEARPRRFRAPLTHGRFAYWPDGQTVTFEDADLGIEAPIPALIVGIQQQPGDGELELALLGVTDG